MAISEKIELLGKGLYGNIPDVLTLTSIPTSSELDYVGSEDFDKTMLDVILPKAVEESIDFYRLLELDYYWICRCLRILNYGPYFTTNAIFCSDCGKVSYGEYSVDVRTVGCKPLPEKFSNDITIEASEFIDFDKSIKIKLPTIGSKIDSDNDKSFVLSNGKRDSELARICYCISSIGSEDSLTPIEIKWRISKELSAADYVILKQRVYELTDYGLRSGGSCGCPKCRSRNASYLALVDDRFFRPTLGDLRNWKRDRSSGSVENLLRHSEDNV